MGATVRDPQKKVFDGTEVQRPSSPVFAESGGAVWGILRRRCADRSKSARIRENGHDTLPVYNSGRGILVTSGCGLSRR